MNVGFVNSSDPKIIQSSPGGICGPYPIETQTSCNAHSGDNIFSRLDHDPKTEFLIKDSKKIICNVYIAPMTDTGIPTAGWLKIGVSDVAGNDRCKPDYLSPNGWKIPIPKNVPAGNYAVASEISVLMDGKDKIDVKVGD